MKLALMGCINIHKFENRIKKLVNDVLNYHKPKNSVEAQALANVVAGEIEYTMAMLCVEKGLGVAYKHGIKNERGKRK